MLQRYSIALAGACVITVMLMYGMSFIAEYFNRPDSEVYLRVMDVIPGSNARRLPEKRMPQSQPERARVEQAIDAVREPPADIVFEQEAGRIDVSVDLEPPAENPSQ
ncbi:MAG TPA: hypothetical protein VKQ06_12260 [Gammaproteobacteria bacterium]|nr:hypothetical protein [Gammaproteobacteria bacterium]